jgi:hypothetical protein
LYLAKKRAKKEFIKVEEMIFEKKYGLKYKESQDLRQRLGLKKKTPPPILLLK